MQNFNYHSHTYRCGHADLDIEDEEYIKEYIKIGFKKIAITDHCPEKNKIDKRNNMRMEYREREEYLKNIKRLRQKYIDKIEIETGYEVEYLPGEEENIQELKQETDKIILGQHFIYDESKELKILGKCDITREDLMKYASYIEKAIELRIPDIIAHPDIFMLSSKEFGENETEATERICKAAEKYKIPLEINLAKVFNKTYYRDKKINNDAMEKQKERLVEVKYPCKEFWKIVSNYDIKVLYGIDAHHRGQISLFHNLVTLANEIIGQDTIDKLNFLKLEE